MTEKRAKAKLPVINVPKLIERLQERPERHPSETVEIKAAIDYLTATGEKGPKDLRAALRAYCDGDGRGMSR
jgi:hypothetical protein